MLNKREALSIVLASLVLGYTFVFKIFTFSEFGSSLLSWLKYSAIILIMLAINVFACKFAASKYGCDAEFNFWNYHRYAIKLRGRKRHYLIPLWLILPLAFSILTYGLIKWLAVLVFEANQKTGGIGHEYSDLSEYELALIAASGPLANLVVAIILQLAGLQEFALMSAALACFNLLPLHELNGSKVFFGSRLLWLFMIAFSISAFILIGISNVTTTIIASVLVAVIAAILLFCFHER